MARHTLTRTATGFSLPFLLAGEPRHPTLNLPERELTTALLQFGKPRRTSLRCIHLERGHGFRALDGQGIYRISEGRSDGYIDITTSISLSVSHRVSTCAMRAVVASRIEVTSVDLVK